MSKVDLSQADLSYADLSYGVISESDFSACRFLRSNFHGVEQQDNQYIGANTGEIQKKDKEQQTIDDKLTTFGVTP